MPDAPSWPTTEAYLYAYRDETPIGRALALHYPSTNGDGPETCAVCCFWGGPPFTDVSPEPWPCPTVRALMPAPQTQKTGD